MLVIRMSTFLLFLFVAWVPLASGNIDGVSRIFIAGFTLQHLMILVLYLAGALVAARWWHKFKLSPSVLVFLSCIALITLSQSVTLKSLINIVIYGVMIFWAAVLVDLFGLDKILQALVSALKLWVFMSILYTVFFWGQSWEYVNGLLSLDSFFSHKNTYGRFLFLAIMFITVSYVAFESKSGNKRSKIKLWFWLGLCLFLTYWTKSKTSLIGAVFAILIPFVFAYFYNVKKVKYLTFSTLVVIGLIFLFILTGSISLWGVGSALDCINFFDVYCMPTTGRATIWETLLSDWIADGKVLSGYGLGYYYEYLAPIRLNGIGLGSFIPDDSHNGYVDLLLNAGLIGAAFFIWLHMRVLAAVVEMPKSESVFCFSVIIISLILNVTESFFVKSTNILVVVLFVVFHHSIGSGRRSVNKQQTIGQAPSKMPSQLNSEIS